MSTIFIKGYKLDRVKIQAFFPRKPQDVDNYDLDYFYTIINNLPDNSYKYVGCGVESDGNLNVVLVLERGFDEKMLKEGDIEPPVDLPEDALLFLTPGVWPSQWDTC